MSRFERAIHKVLFRCLNLRQDESLLILCDAQNSHIATSFAQKAILGKIETYQLIVPKSVFSDDEINALARQFVTHTDAILFITIPSLVHSKIIPHACHNGKRVICFNFHDQHVFENSLSADIDTIAHKSRKIADIFSIGKQVKVQTRAGTDFSFRIARHKGNINHGCAKNPGEYGILPAGEAYVIPDKNTMNGVIIIDGSIPEIGLVKSQIKLHVKNGYVSQITGGELLEALRKRIKPFGKRGRNVAEFGIGTNPAVQLTGKSIADEKKSGTAHIALGDHLLEGGSTSKKLHLDMIFNNPTVTIDGRQLMVGGKLIN